jgi:tripartite-type tricarboxylate transporter receptor subunit TctC
MRTTTRIKMSEMERPCSSPADFAKFVADETEKWSKVIRAANIKAE